MLSVREETKRLNARLDKLERAIAELREIVEAKLGTPVQPTFTPRPARKVPVFKDYPLEGYAESGVNYTGAPSEAASAAGGSGPSLAGYRRQGDGTYWRDPCGILRGPDGEIVTPRVDQPISPVRTPQHQQAIDLIDGMAKVHPDE